jgi:hypothetical protein
VILGIGTAVLSGYRTYKVDGISILEVDVEPSSTSQVTYYVANANFISVEYYDGVSCSVRILLSLDNKKVAEGTSLAGLDCETTIVYLRIPEKAESNLKLTVQNFSDENSKRVSIRISEYIGVMPYAYLSIVAFILWLFGTALMLKAITVRVFDRQAKNK